MALFRYLSDNSNPHSLAVRFRRRRFAFFKALISALPRPHRILDVGGTQQYWEHMQFADEDGVHITILNLDPVQLGLQRALPGRTRFEHFVGDARNMPQFRDGEFDVVFSNSVIEHVGSFDDQKRMVEELCRVGRRYVVQTPNYYFPVEPHFHVLGFQFMPEWARVFLLQNFALGWSGKATNRTEARTIVRSVRLLTRRELGRLCPGASLHEEKVLGLVKSFMAYGGWDRH